MNIKELCKNAVGLYLCNDGAIYYVGKTPIDDVKFCKNIKSGRVLFSSDRKTFNIDDKGDEPKRNSAIYSYTDESFNKIKSYEKIFNCHNDSIMLTFTFKFMHNISFNDLQNYTTNYYNLLNNFNCEVHKFFTKKILNVLKKRFSHGLWITEKTKKGVFHFHVKVVADKEFDFFAFWNRKGVQTDIITDHSFNYGQYLTNHYNDHFIFNVDYSRNRKIYLGYLDKLNQKKFTFDKQLWHYWGFRNSKKFFEITEREAYALINSRTTTNAILSELLIK